MKKKFQMFMAMVCYAFGIVSSVYVGGWMMLILPVQRLLGAYSAGMLSLSLVIVSAIKIFLSLTVAGFFWCVGYVGYNHFIGTEDPDWEAINQRIAKQRDHSGKEHES